MERRLSPVDGDVIGIRISKPIKALVYRGVRRNTAVNALSTLASSHLPIGFPIFSAAEVSQPLIRVRLIDSKSGHSNEIIPEMPLHYLSEITSKFIGYDKRYALRYSGTDLKNLTGEETATVLLGGYLSDATSNLPFNCLELDNNTYLEVDLYNLAGDTEVEHYLYGIEDHVVSKTATMYSRLFVPSGEISRNFGLSGYNRIYLPLTENLSEIQLYPMIASLSSPVMTVEELRQYERLKNDITFVSSAAIDFDDYVGGGESIVTSTKDRVAGFVLSYSRFSVLPVMKTRSLDIRKKSTDTSSLDFVGVGQGSPYGSSLSMI